MHGRAIQLIIGSSAYGQMQNDGRHKRACLVGFRVGQAKYTNGPGMCTLIPDDEGKIWAVVYARGR